MSTLGGEKMSQNCFLPQRRKENAKDAKIKYLIINPLRTFRKTFAPLRLIFLTYETASFL